jgi:hypothetical protein
MTTPYQLQLFFSVHRQANFFVVAQMRTQKRIEIKKKQKKNQF